ELESADRDPHVEELRFIDSAGTWSPDGRQFAFATVERGNNGIEIVDVDRGRAVKRYEPDVGEVSSLSWSPDGRRIAFAGLREGIPDLFLLELSSGHVLRLTDDPYGDLQPTWSKDGKSLLFVSDRGAGSDLATLQYAKMGLFVLDLDSKQVRPLPTLPGAAEI